MKSSLSVGAFAALLPPIDFNSIQVSTIKVNRQVHTHYWFKDCREMDHRVPALIRRDGVLCHYCGCQLYQNPKEGYHPQGVSIDHIVPQKRGGSNELTNLVLSCRRCNSRKHTRDYWDFRQENETTQMILFMMESEAS